jgi:hypothetical protein
MLSWFKRKKRGLTTEIETMREEKLLAAAKYGKVVEVEALMLQGADIEYQEPDTVSSFSHEVTAIRILPVFCLWMQGDPWTALIWASNNGHLAVVECLLRHGAKVDHQNKYVSSLSLPVGYHFSS